MKRILFAAISLAATPALAQSPFDGTWKADLKTATYSSPPDIYTLGGGKFSCPSCKPGYSVPADGAFHKVAGHSYFDEQSVTIVDPHTVKFAQRKGGKLIYEETDTVSADGKTVKQVSNDMSGTTPVAATMSETRIGMAPAGMHAISGHWKPEVASQVSAAGMTITMKVTGDMISVVTPTGTSYVAKFGGPAVPMKGDIGGTMVQLTRLSPKSFQVTSMREGKTTGVSTITVNDAKSLTYTSMSQLYGYKSTIKAYRQ